MQPINGEFPVFLAAHFTFGLNTGTPRMSEFKQPLTTAIDEISRENKLAKQAFRELLEKIQDLLAELKDYPEISIQVDTKDDRAILTFPIPSASVVSTTWVDRQTKLHCREDVVDLDIGELTLAIVGKTREDAQTHYAYSYSTPTELAESYLKHLALSVNTIRDSREGTTRAAE